MRLIDASTTKSLLDFPSLVDVMESQFKTGAELPLRHHHVIKKAHEDDASILIMPAWECDGFLGVKLVTVVPGNSARGLPSVMASYILSSSISGEVLAIIDGPELTARRTAAVSALASIFLSRKDCSTLLMIGTGVMAPNLVHAHASVRPIKKVIIWGRNRENAEHLSKLLSSDGLFEVCVTDNLKKSASYSDIISCATLSTEPIIKGNWLQKGQHIDLVGAFKPEMRESDDECMRLSKVFVDTCEGALSEGGDVVQAIRSGALVKDNMKGDLFELCSNQVAGREEDDEITLFKSAGSAIEDLAAAKLIFNRSHKDD